jgi:hypothetical protein
MRSCRAASLQRRAAYSIQQDETDELMLFCGSIRFVCGELCAFFLQRTDCLPQQNYCPIFFVD